MCNSVTVCILNVKLLQDPDDSNNEKEGDFRKTKVNTILLILWLASIIYGEPMISNQDEYYYDGLNSMTQATGPNI